MEDLQRAMTNQQLTESAPASASAPSTAEIPAPALAETQPSSEEVKRMVNGNYSYFTCSCIRIHIRAHLRRRQHQPKSRKMLPIQTAWRSDLLLFRVELVWYLNMITFVKENEKVFLVFHGTLYSTKTTTIFTIGKIYSKIPCKRCYRQRNLFL